MTKPENKMLINNKSRKHVKKFKKSVDTKRMAWYNNKAVGRKQQTKSERQLQKVSWKLNNALYKTLEDSESKSRNYLRSQAEDKIKSAS